MNHHKIPLTALLLSALLLPLATAATAPVVYTESAAGGSEFSIFLKTNGTAWTCGGNSSGRLGRCTTPEPLLNGNPGISNLSILPVLTSTPISGGRNLIFKYKRKLAATDVTPVVESSALLTSSWSTAVHGQNGVTISTRPVDAIAEEVTITIPTVDGKRFV